MGSFLILTNVISAMITLFFFPSMFYIFYVFYVYLPKGHLNKLQASNKLILKELSAMPCY